MVFRTESKMLSHIVHFTRPICIQTRDRWSTVIRITWLVISQLFPVEIFGFVYWWCLQYGAGDQTKQNTVHSRTSTFTMQMMRSQSAWIKLAYFLLSKGNTAFVTAGKSVQIWTEYEEMNCCFLFWVGQCTFRQEAKLVPIGVIRWVWF